MTSKDKPRPAHESWSDLEVSVVNRAIITVVQENHTIKFRTLHDKVYRVVQEKLGDRSPSREDIVAYARSKLNAELPDDETGRTSYSRQKMSGRSEERSLGDSGHPFGKEVCYTPGIDAITH